MPGELVGIIALVVLLVFLVMGLPVVVSLALVGIVGYIVMGGWHATLGIVGLTTFTAIHSHALTVVPLFILIGNIVIHVGLAKDVFTALHHWLSRLPGGLAHATVFVCTVFAAASGSGIAASAIFTKLAVPEMKKAGYSMALACGAVAAAGPLASMIPPSVVMVTYTMVSDSSLGELLIAGVFPGIMISLLFVTMILIHVTLNPSLAPRATGVSWKARFQSLSMAWPIIVIIVFVLGSIYAGIATPTEAGAMGVGGALIVGLAMRRLTWRALRDSLLDAAVVTGMIMLIFVAAKIFANFMVLSGLTQSLTIWVTGLGVSPVLVIVMIMIMYIFLGCFMNSTAMIFITGPAVIPLVTALGFSLTWFGILVVCVIELGAITPPFGICLFAVKGALPKDCDVPLGTILKGALPFMACYLVALSLLIAFPKIALFLPGTMRGG